MPARITFVGHATVAVELDGTRLLTDPFLRSRLGPLRRHGPPVAQAALESLDAVLISHLHRDHADLALAAPARGRAAARARRAAPASSSAGASGRCPSWRSASPTQVGAVTVTAVEAVHDGGGKGSRDAERDRVPALRPAADLLRRGHRPLRRHELAARTSTWRCCRSGAGARASAPGTWTPRGRLALRRPDRAEDRRPDPLGDALPEVPAPPAPRAAQRPAARARAVDEGAGASGGAAGARPGRVHLGRVGGVPERARASRGRRGGPTRRRPPPPAGHSRSAGCRTKGNDWVPPSPPCEPTSSSKAETSPVAGSKALLIIRSAQWGKPSVRRT